MVYLLFRIAAALMFAIITLTFLQVVMRYAFNQPISWMEEISRYLFVWIVMLGSALAFRNTAHIKIDILDPYLGPRSLKNLNALRVAASIIAISLLMYSGYLLAWRNRYQTFYTLPDLPLLLLYTSMPLSCVLMIVFLVRELRKVLIRKQ